MQETFKEAFKLSLSRIAWHLDNGETIYDDARVRNFLMFLYWARHYPSFRLLGAFFGLGKSQACAIIHGMLDRYATLHSSVINLDNVDILEPNPYDEWVIGVVDCTELIIESWIPVC